MSSETQMEHISAMLRAKELARGMVPEGVWRRAISVKRAVDGRIRTYPQNIGVSLDGVQARLFVTGPVEHDRARTLVNEGRYILDMLKVLKPESTVWDVGAGIGSHAILLAKKASLGKVIAIEPDPKTIDRLNLNIGINFLDNITVVPYAVSDHNCQITIHTSGLEGEAPSVYWENNGITHSSSLVTHAYTLDFLSAYYPKPDVLKVDVEGHEIEVLSGMVIKPQHIFVEIHPKLGSRSQKVHQILTSKGYRCVRQYTRGTEILAHFAKLENDN